MKMFLWKRIQQCSDKYHCEGGVVVFAENEKSARKMAHTQDEGGYDICSIAENEKPDDVRDVFGGVEKVYYFPDAGCCGQ
ncbi:MAG: hypothetical protein GY821_12790 [Gammaproteobacteria bacterium]|nr:hypothetical protein [Gammaproteobacteria bacterium]